MAFLIGGANSAADTGYNIANSLRSNQPDAAYLSFAVSSPNTDIFTISMWVKTSLISSGSITFFEIGKALTGEIGDYTTFAGHLDVDGRTQFDAYDGVANGFSIRWGTPPATVLRDPSAWYHIVMRMDSSQAVLANRARIYLNGEDISSRMTKTVDPDQNDDYFNATGSSVYFPGGVSYTGANTKWNGHIAECAYIDGTSYAASTFAETDEDSGIWKPKDFKDDVTFGTNGLYLEFKQSGTNQDSSGLGADTSGNDNHMAVTNFVATDQCTDTPTNNFATLNPLTDATNDLSEGNTVSDLDDGTYATSTTIFAANGKWYAEFKVTDLAGSDAYIRIGVVSAEQNASNLGDGNETYCFLGDGRTYVEGSASSYGSAINTDDIFMVALDTDNNKVWYGINGTWLESGTVGDPAGNSNESHAIDSGPAFGFAIASGSGSYSPEIQCNFGNPAFSISSGNADANGYGNFEYAVPSGFYALCTKNLAEFG